MFRRRWSYRAATVGAPMVATPVPKQLPGLVLWMDPTQEAGYTLLDEVNPVTDWSGNGWNGTPEAGDVGPLYIPEERNGLGVFEGTLGTSFETIGLNLQDGDYTLYVACSYLVGFAGNQQRLVHSSTGSPFIFGVDLDTGVGTGDVFHDNAIGVTQGTGVDGWQILSLRCKRSGDPNRVEVRQELDGSGGLVSLIAGGSNYPAGGADIVRPTWFSQNNGGAHYYLGQTGDIALYNAAHGIGDVLRMFDYLREKWGL